MAYYQVVVREAAVVVTATGVVVTAEEESRGRVSTNKCPLDQKLHIQGLSCPHIRRLERFPLHLHLDMRPRLNSITRKRRDEDAMDVLMTTIRF
jgi:hypothetical protein